MSLPYISCANYPPEAGCCSSCHYDWEEGLDWPLEIEGFLGGVCCQVTIWIDNHPDEAKAIVAALRPEAAP